MQALLVDAVRAVLHRETSHAIDLSKQGLQIKGGFLRALTA